MTTLLNILTVDPADQPQLLEMLHENIATVIHTLDGWISTSLIASADGKRVVIHSLWRDAAAIASMRSDPRMVAYFPKIAALASFDSIVGEVAHAAGLIASRERNEGL
jgi:quinol monooxygenase YgiN